MSCRWEACAPTWWKSTQLCSTMYRKAMVTSRQEGGSSDVITASAASCTSWSSSSTSSSSLCDPCSATGSFTVNVVFRSLFLVQYQPHPAAAGLFLPFLHPSVTRALQRLSVQSTLRLTAYCKVSCILHLLLFLFILTAKHALQQIHCMLCSLHALFEAAFLLLLLLLLHTE